MLNLELANGGVAHLGSVSVVGNSSVEQELPLGIKEMPKRAMINYFDYVLATVN
jgi:hypothetical protein